MSGIIEAGPEADLAVANAVRIKARLSGWTIECKIGLGWCYRLDKNGRPGQLFPFRPSKDWRDSMEALELCYSNNIDSCLRRSLIDAVHFAMHPHTVAKELWQDGKFDASEAILNICRAIVNHPIEKKEN